MLGGQSHGLAAETSCPLSNKDTEAWKWHFRGNFVRNFIRNYVWSNLRSVTSYDLRSVTSYEIPYEISYIISYEMISEVSLSSFCTKTISQVPRLIISNGNMNVVPRDYSYHPPTGTRSPQRVWASLSQDQLYLWGNLNQFREVFTKVQELPCCITAHLRQCL